MTDAQINEIFQSVADMGDGVHLRFARAIREEVIEQCAKVCEDKADGLGEPTWGIAAAKYCADAIRAMKETPNAQS